MVTTNHQINSRVKIRESIFSLRQWSGYGPFYLMCGWAKSGASMPSSPANQFEIAAS